MINRYNIFQQLGILQTQNLGILVLGAFLNEGTCFLDGDLVRIRNEQEINSPETT